MYESGSSEDCPGIDVVEVPFGDPGSASQINFDEPDRDCHDIGVILGDAMKGACAGDDGFAALDLSASFEDPSQPYSAETYPQPL